MKAIRHFRQRAKLTQGQLAKALDCSQPTVSAMERGTTPLVLAQLERVAEICGCTVTDLVEWRDDDAADPVDEPPPPHAA